MAPRQGVLTRRALVAGALLPLVPAPHLFAAAAAGELRLKAPIWVYNNWSAYDELSDAAPLTEDLAMRELRQILRLRQAGVRIDYYVMDAFWFDPDGGYRTWRKEYWPEGPDRWLAACRDNHIEPGLWFGTNSLVHLNPTAKWRSSLTVKKGAMALYAGDFLPDFMEVLQYWYERGIRLFKLDFANFGAAAAGDEHRLEAREIRRRNREALRQALLAFRHKNPDIVMDAFNGFVGDVGTAKSVVPHSAVRWLDVFDALYAGDPRPSNVPEMNFWRSVDIYSDRMVRRFEQAGVSVKRIDSTGFMIGDTGTIFGRRTAGWRGMLLLMMARGGWINTVHGNLEFLDDADLRWFAQAQQLYDDLQRGGVTEAFGGLAGDRLPYGFVSATATGSVYTVVNPAQAVQSAQLPAPPHATVPPGGGRILFRDAGFIPVIEGHELRLGPGQMAVVGFGDYTAASHDLGLNVDIRIPLSIAPIPASFIRTANKQITVAATIAPPAGDLRIIMRQEEENGGAMRSFSEAKMGEHFTISVTQSGRRLPVTTQYDKLVWSGLSWAAGEIPHADFAPGVPIEIRLSSADSDLTLRLAGHLYAVSY
jgi:hypothetical protein